MNASPFSGGWPSTPVGQSAIEGQVAACDFASAQVNNAGGSFLESQNHHREPSQHPIIPVGLKTVLSDTPLQTPQVYRAQELADKVIEGSRLLHEPRTMTHEQLCAKNRVEQLNASAQCRYRNITGSDVSRWPTICDMEEYMKAFDDFLFFGTLKEMVSLELHRGFIPSPSGPAVGWTRYEPIAPEVLITLSNFDEWWTTPRSQYSSIVGTLLHEMVHALFLIYGCNYARCTADEAMRRTVGFTGHGPTWEKLAAEVRAAVGTHFNDLVAFGEFDHMGVERSVNHELGEGQRHDESAVPEPYFEDPWENGPIATRTRNAQRLRRM
ncbi:hypothetical protein LPUS_00737 [Lasallia pustulata]|uniref:SprT-like domain-containing protein n=1 Tax=Lasallia pustulata TaxID=136370 RepID=A0A1W5D326_9LECA|nr:hypothetical protein LPUS_00737 [Lasallia pustulata]